jgi:hypothetical protein
MDEMRNGYDEMCLDSLGTMAYNFYFVPPFYNVVYRQIGHLRALRR